MVEQQRIIGIDDKCGKFVTSTRGPTLMLILEMYRLHNKTNAKRFTFSYNHKKETSILGVKEHIAGEWTPAQYKDTYCGHIAKKADDHLKEFLEHLTSMRRVSDIAQQMYIPANFIAGTSFTVKLTASVSRICIEPKEVVLFSNSLSIKEIRWRISYSVLDLEGNPLSLSDSELNYVDDLEKNIIPTIIENQPSHPFALFKDVVMAQHIACFIIDKKLHLLLSECGLAHSLPVIEKENEPNFFVNSSTKPLKFWYTIEANVGVAILAKLGTEEIPKYYFLRRMHQKPENWTIYNSVDEQSIKGMNLATGTQVVYRPEGGVSTEYKKQCLKSPCDLMRNPFSQFQNPWTSDPMGQTSGTTIGKDGCLITAIASLLTGCGIELSLKGKPEKVECNPGTLNTYLQENNGYVGNLFNWEIFGGFGMTYKGKITDKDVIKEKMKNFEGVSLLLKIGHHWVLGIRLENEDGKDGFYAINPGNKPENIKKLKFYSFKEVKEAALVEHKC